MANPLRITDLRGLSLGALEELYRTAPLGPMPRGAFRGEVLMPVDSRFARSVRGRMVLMPFARAPFGIDFAEKTWFFFSPRARIGRFRAELGPSRWRDTDVLRLEYDVSRLPRPIRRVLYDEVKPLSEGVCLGLGGANAGRDAGDLFFFALTALAARSDGTHA